MQSQEGSQLVDDLIGRIFDIQPKRLSCLNELRYQRRRGVPDDLPGVIDPASHGSQTTPPPAPPRSAAWLAGAYSGRSGPSTLMTTLPGARPGRRAWKAAGRSSRPKTAETTGRSRWLLTSGASSRSWPPSGLTTK